MLRLLEEVYFGKAKDVVGELRSKSPTSCQLVEYWADLVVFRSGTALGD